jgi:hypothetical protein
MISLLRVVLIAAAGVQTLAAQSATSPELQRLSPILGTWNVEDIYRPIGGGEIRETGVRTCAWVLQRRYVECVTQGRNPAGREREYRWFINYNTETNRYETAEVFSNYSGKIVRTFRIDSTGLVWNIRAPSSMNGGIEQWSWAQLVFRGTDSATWTGYRNLETQSAREWAESTRETWVRIR